ncbi:hypothetical protein ACRN9F_05850 [Shewanella oncorhynchi]|uniref:hypothetical protein n=1 Tax=Shewanella oncorhynchi TaxID=2726434 RepID=UPI003D7BC38E
MAVPDFVTFIDNPATSMLITAACEFILTAQKSPSDTAIYHMIEGRCISIDKHSSGRGHHPLQTDAIKIM